MNPPIAYSPLIPHIPHAVPVVIIWGIMLRFYVVQRRLKKEQAGSALVVPVTDPATPSASVRTAADRPGGRRVWAADDDLPTTDASSDRDEAPVLGRTPAGRV